MRYFSLFFLYSHLLLAQSESGIGNYLNPNLFFDYAQIDGGFNFDVSPEGIYFNDNFAFGAGFQIADDKNALFCRATWDANSYLEDWYYNNAGPFSEIQYRYQRKLNLKGKYFKSLVWYGGGIYAPWKSNILGHSFQGQNELHIGLRFEKHLSKAWSIYPSAQAFFRAGEYSKFESYDTIQGTDQYFSRYSIHYSKARGMDLGVLSNYQLSPTWLLQIDFKYRFMNFHKYGAAMEFAPGPYKVLARSRFLHLIKWDADLAYAPNSYFVIRLGLRAYNEIYTGLGWMEYDWMLRPQLKIRVIMD